METKRREYSILENGDNFLKDNKQKFAMDVLSGLSKRSKRLPTEYIYDENGSELFKKITELPEYYLTKSETRVLQHNKNRLLERLNRDNLNLIELGAGDGKKTKIIIEEFLSKSVQFHYIPIDISVSAMEGLLKDFNSDFTTLKIKGIVSDYFNGIKWLSNLTTRQNLVLFLGSNIGNFNLLEISTFLSSLWHTLNNNDLILIGFDLKKDIRKMEDAYNDSSGVTALFNLNLLKRINRELKGEFDIAKFRFYSTYDVVDGAIKSYLISQDRQEIYIDELKRSFSFKEWEPIHTESSHKFSIEDIEELAEQNKFEVIEHYFDPEKQFTDSLWRVKKK